jgi:hypothetical protein
LVGALAETNERLVCDLALNFSCQNLIALNFSCQNLIALNFSCQNLIALNIINKIYLLN